MVTSGTLGQFQLVFQEKDVGDVLDGALDQVGVTTYLNEQMSWGKSNNFCLNNVLLFSLEPPIHRAMQLAVLWSCLWVV